MLPSVCCLETDGNIQSDREFTLLCIVSLIANAVSTNEPRSVSTFHVYYKLSPNEITGLVYSVTCNVFACLIVIPVCPSNGCL